MMSLFFFSQSNFSADYFYLSLCTNRWRLYSWGGKLHKLPRGYTLTSSPTLNAAAKRRTARQAYVRWFFPDRTQNFPPLRLCCGTDFSTKSQRNRFFDWKKLVQRLQFYLVEESGEQFSVTQTELEAVTQFDKTIDIHYDIYVRAFHPSAKKRKRRLKKCNAAVSTVVEEMRVVSKTIARLPNLIRLWNAFTTFQRVCKYYFLTTK